MDFACEPGLLWFRIKVPFALWVMAEVFDAEHAVSRSKKNITSLKATPHFANSITT